MNIVLYSVRLGDSEHKPISDVFTNATDGGGQGQFFPIRLQGVTRRVPPCCPLKGMQNLIKQIQFHVNNIPAFKYMGVSSFAYKKHSVLKYLCLLLTLIS